MSGSAGVSIRRPLELLQHSIGNRAVLQLARVHDVIHSSGAPLDPRIRTVMEPRFARDFSGVRVHADSRAADAAAAVNAHAFTVGRDIVFGRQQYDPVSRRGSELLAHELAHTVQQGHRRPTSGEALTILRPADAPEREAETAANAVVSGSSAGILSPSGTAIARQAVSEEPSQIAFEGRVLKADRVSQARDVPLPDLPEGLAPNVVAAIQEQAKTIIRELASLFPNVTLILSIVTKWYEADERLGQDERFFRPHLDTLLITLDAHALNAHTTALDEMWHRFAAHRSVMQENFLYILRTSYSYRNYSPGPPLRGLLDHEGRRADELRTRVLRGDYKAVDQALDEPWAQNRDDVAVALVTYLSDETLKTMAMSAAGRSLLDHLLFELTRGSLGADEGRQASRILSAKASRIPLAEVERQLLEGATKIFPYRETGITVFGAAPVRARRLADGRIWVQMPMNVRTNSTYSRETSTLPLSTFTTGIVLPENEIVGVRLYDQGEVTVYAPALYLVQISNQSLTQTLSKIAEVAGLGAGIGMALLVEAGVAATAAARLLLWADRAALVLGILGSAVLEHRGWIIKNVPFGRQLIEIVEIINSVVALYGMVRFVAGMPSLVKAARDTFQEWRAWRAAAREVTEVSEGRRAATALDPPIDQATKEINHFEQLPKEERAQIISMVGGEQTGLPKQGSLPPEGPGPAAPSQAVPKVVEEEMGMASGMKQRPSPVIEDRPKAVRSGMDPEASATPSGRGSTTLDQDLPPKTSGTTTPSSTGEVSPTRSVRLYEEDTARLATLQSENKQAIDLLKANRKSQLRLAEQLEREADEIRKAKSTGDYWAQSKQRLAEAQQRRSNAEKLGQEIAGHENQNALIADELKSRAGLQPGETIQDLASRWFGQRPGETLEEYGRRMAARRTMVEEEATRPGGRPEVAALHDEILQSISERSKQLVKAEQELAAAEKAARAAREEWYKVTESLRKERKGRGELPAQERMKESEWIQREKQLEAARQEVRRAQFGVDRTGEIGEYLAKKYLEAKGYTNIRSIQNASGHGIDLVAERNGKTYFFEVKASESSYAPALSAREKNIDWFVRDVLNTSSLKDAKDLLAQINAGTLKVEGFVIEVTDISLVSYKHKIAGQTKW